MLGNVYINQRHARECLHLISLYCRKGFSHSFNFFVVSKKSFQNFRKKRKGGGSDFSSHKNEGAGKIGGVVLKNGGYHLFSSVIFL